MMELTTHSGSLQERTESRLALVLAKSGLQEAKKELPFALINIPSGGVAQHLFPLPLDFQGIFTNEPRAGGELDDTLKLRKFVIVTGDGELLVYDTTFRRLLRRIEVPGLEQVTWGHLFSSASSDSWSTLLLHSRKLGFCSTSIPFDLGAATATTAPSPLVELTPFVHSGFCRPCICSDGSVLVPTDLCKVSLYHHHHHHPESDFQNSPLSPIHEFSSTLMAMLEVTFDTIPVDSKYVAFSLESGSIELLRISSSSTPSVTAVAKFDLPKDLKSGESRVGTCLIGRGDLLAVGTTSTVIYLLKLEILRDKGTSNKTLEVIQFKPYLKKTLPTEGVSNMALNENGTMLAVAGFDGTVRILSFPRMEQVASFRCRGDHVNSVLFLEGRENSGMGKFVACAAAASVTVWRVDKGDRGQSECEES